MVRIFYKTNIFIVNLNFVEGLKNVFTYRDSLSRSLEPCCDVDHSLECHDVDVDPEALHDKEDISFNGVVLKFANLIPPHGQVYKTEKVADSISLPLCILELFKRVMRQSSATTIKLTASSGL